MEDYEVFDDGRIKYYIGDLHILDDPFFIISVTKDVKGRILQPSLQTD